MAANASGSYFAKFASTKQEFPQLIQKFITSMCEADAGKVDIDFVEFGLNALLQSRSNVNPDELASKVEELSASYDNKIIEMNKLTEKLEEDLLILQQLKTSLHKENKRKLQSLVDALTFAGSVANRHPSPKPSPTLSAATSNHVKAARRSVQLARRSTASGMRIRRSKLNSSRRGVASSRGVVGDSYFRGVKSRGVMASSQSRLEAIQRRNQEQCQQHQTSETRLSPRPPDASPESFSDNDSGNESRRVLVSKSSPSPARSRNRESGTIVGTSHSGGDGSSERLYCLCQRYSFGDMIACDNARCEIEWFHFACVDVKTQPKGRWYCPRCRGETSKVKRLDV